MKFSHLKYAALGALLIIGCGPTQPAAPGYSMMPTTPVVAPVAAPTAPLNLRYVYKEEEPCPNPTRVAADGSLEINEEFIRVVGQPAYVAGDRNGWVYKYTQKGAPAPSKYELQPGSTPGWYRMPDGWHAPDQFNVVQRDDSSGHPGEALWMQIQCAIGKDPNVVLRPDNSGDMALEVP